MNEEQTLPLNSKKNVLRILGYLPHSNILNMSRINKLFHLTIKDFEIFEGYTLKFDCGRRGSVVGGKGRFVDNKGRLMTSKSSEVVINDKQKVILISTNNKPLKSERVKEALIAISRTSINKIYFRSYRITQNISLPPSANSSPLYQTDIINTFHNQRRSTKLQPINEKSHNGLNGTYGPSPASSLRSRFSSGASAASASSTSSITTTSTTSTASPSFTAINPKDSPVSISLVAPSPSFTAGDRQSYSSTISTIGNDIVELSLPSTTRLSTISSGVSVSSGSKRSTAIFAATDSKDNQFEALLEILNKAPFQSLTIGEECVSWTWSNVITVLQHFQNIAHLAVHIGFEQNKMPNIKSEQKWLDFVGTNYLNVLQLQSLWCNDDAFLRCITSLSSYRNLGKHLTFIEDGYGNNNNNNNIQQIQQYEKGSLLKPKQINTEDMDVLNGTDILNGRYVKKHDIDIEKLSALQFVRYRCQFAPENDLSGIEFEGAAILELSPYDSMFITIPCSVISFRISLPANFYEEPDEYKIVIPYTNNLRELCLYKIENLKNVHGLYHLKKLQYIVIKKKPKDINVFKKYILSLSKYAPIKEITLMFMNKYKKSRNNNSNDNEYWQNLQRMTVKTVKDEMKITDHPNLISIKNNYEIPMNIPALADQSKFTAYSTK